MCIRDRFRSLHGLMPGWSLCKQCRAVTWKDAAGRTFGCAMGCTNSRPKTRAIHVPTRQAFTDLANDTTQPPETPRRTMYSLDSRGDCRPAWSGAGTGNFTISQSARFPPHKRRPGEGLTYDITGANAKSEVQKRATRSAAFRDKAKRGLLEKMDPPSTVGPATYLRHRLHDGVDGHELNKTYSAGGATLRARSTRDIYGPGGMANMGMKASPVSTHSYIGEQQTVWKRKLSTNQLGWATKGSSFAKSSRFSTKSPAAPPPGAYHGLHSPTCLLYTSDAADEEDSVDLGGRRIIKKKKKKKIKTVVKK
eukprot:TRINITY_DN5206_c0_g1_i2.p1 TRINITY_DN5206_c0_g1~~TRINITY_DN5206_c0_g1_i2.p1  ORF type:complete len:308 (-),score=66.40 TRINITY_DN5206_c0_g1_i2:81-1004(-)